jgi:hypothetical protein
MPENTRRSSIISCLVVLPGVRKKVLVLRAINDLQIESSSLNDVFGNHT